ncbi:ATP-binding protein [Massilia sp. H6]|uniref:hybrid sensor histidine kinase/response regulator n=1 Tax=Massilia sp. H6 TaxID=2970464 RepID=UPI0021671BEB|nr:ATP-binding protein [Massilia sp. H6]UVW26860.1 ATP-binding protein [Massilia sp. H6]
MSQDYELEQMRSAALRNAQSVLAARQRAEEELLGAQDALRRANERMENMLESLSDGFCAVDRDWRITYINGRALDMIAPLDKSRAGLVGRSLWDEFEDLQGTSVAQDCLRAMELRESVVRDFYYARLQCWVEMRLHPSPDGLTLYFQDITQRKLDQQALVENNTRLQVALAAGRLGDWRWDAAPDRVRLGPRAACILGLPADIALRWPQLRARLLPQHQRPVRRAVLSAIKSRSDLNIECQVAGDGPGGQPARWVALVGRPDYAEVRGQQTLLGMSGVVQDITSRKEAEETLRQSEELLRALANTIPQLAWMAGVDGAIVWFNDRWYDYTGRTPEQSVGRSWQEAIEPGALDGVMAHWRATIQSGAPFEMEFPLLGADGRYRWHLTRVRAVRDPEGRVLRWFGTNTDVDGVKRTEQALRDESHVLELLNNTGSILASTRDLRSLLRAATEAAAGVSGAHFGAFFHVGQAGDASEPGAQEGTLFSLYTLAGTTSTAFCSVDAARAATLFGPLLRAPGLVRIDDIESDARYAGSAPQFGLPDGHPPVRSYMAVPVIARSGELLGTMLFGDPAAGIFSERSERIVSGIALQAAIAVDNARLYEATSRAAEERKVLLENEREARAEAERSSQMKDEFLATLSHELRTPLSAILGWSQVLRRGSRDGADLQRGLQTIERNARAQAQLIEDLLDMSRITSGKVLLEMQVIAPGPFIDAAIETVRPAAEAKQIAIERLDGTPAAAGLRVAGDSGRLQQVVWNLLSNAIKFTPRGGTVAVELAQHEHSLAITVRDNGAGIRPEFITHVFERFRQEDASMTRRHGGLGLGLSIVKHLVEQHGGTVRAESAGEGLGASFTIELPLAKAATGAPPRGNGRPALSAAPEAPEAMVRDLAGVTVLVVDDDRDSRELIARILTDCHARVQVAASAREAFAVLKANKPDILISDVGMPEVDGFEFIGWVRALAREQGGQMPAIALTAFARSEDRLKALEAGFSTHISKPVEPSELIATIATVTAPGAPLMLSGHRTNGR